MKLKIGDKVRIISYRYIPEVVGMIGEVVLTHPSTAINIYNQCNYRDTATNTLCGVLSSPTGLWLDKNIIIFKTVPDITLNRLLYPEFKPYDGYLGYQLHKGIHYV